MKNDVERQSQLPLSGIPTASWKERILEFLDHYFGSVKLYFYSFPMPDSIWDNRRWRLRASGVQITPLAPLEPQVDRIVHIEQKQPAE